MGLVVPFNTKQTTKGIGLKGTIEHAMEEGAQGDYQSIYPTT